MSRFFFASEPPDAKGRIMCFDELFAHGCGAIGVWGQSEAEGLEELCQCEEVLMHAEVLAMDSSKEVGLVRVALEEGDHHLPPESFTLVASMFFACDDLVLYDVHEGGWGLMISYT